MGHTGFEWPLGCWHLWQGHAMGLPGGHVAGRGPSPVRSAPSHSHHSLVAITSSSSPSQSGDNLVDFDGVPTIATCIHPLNVPKKKRQGQQHPRGSSPPHISPCPTTIAPQTPEGVRGHLQGGRSRRGRSGGRSAGSPPGSHSVPGQRGREVAGPRARPSW